MKKTVFAILAVLLGTAAAQMEWTCVCSSAVWEPRSMSAVVAYHGWMWQTGGLRDTGVPQPFGDVWKTTDGGSWSQVTPAAPWGPRDCHTSVVFHDTMWVVSGESAATGQGYRDVWCSVNGEDWARVVASAPWPGRLYASLTVFRDTMWLAGGNWFNGSVWEYLDDFWNSGDGRNWFRVDSTAPWGRRGHQSTVVFRDTMWLIAGFDGNSAYNDVWKSADGRNWTRTTAFPWTPRAGHASVVFDDKMWILGGSTASGQTMNDVWCSEDGQAWALADSAADWCPRVWMNSAVHDGRVWVTAGSVDIVQFRGLNDVWCWPAAGVEERPMPHALGSAPSLTIVRGVLWLAPASSSKLQATTLLDISGRTVMELRPGANVVRHLAPGVYFVRGEGSRDRGVEGSSVRKIIATR